MAGGLMSVYRELHGRPLDRNADHFVDSAGPDVPGAIGQPGTSDRRTVKMVANFAAVEIPEDGVSCGNFRGDGNAVSPRVTLAAHLLPARGAVGHVFSGTFRQRRPSGGAGMFRMGAGAAAVDHPQCGYL